MQVVGGPNSTGEGMNKNKYWREVERELCLAVLACEEETLAIHRDRGTNGNEIGENITIIKRKPRHGLYITGAFYQ